MNSMVGSLYKRYVLCALTLVCALNYLDRGLIALLLQPIKEDLKISDTKLGCLTGIAFGLFYATLGLPIARLADKRNRVTLTSVAIGLWGVTVMLCVFVTSFAQLVAARIAAGVGEAGCAPPTYSLVGEFFVTPGERARAMSFYSLSGPIAAIISFVVGGRLNDIYGWRMTFFAMGVPALMVALIVKLTVVDPRASRKSDRDDHGRLPSVRDVMCALWRQKSSRHLIAALVLLFTLGMGMAPWYAAFLMRSHRMSTTEIGLWMGLIFGIGGIAGTLLGGYVAGRWFADDERGQMRLMALLTAALVPCFASFLLAPSNSLSLAALVPLMMVFTFFLGPTYALMQRLVVDEMRATTFAVAMLLANLIGMGAGPQIVGLLSDQFLQIFGTDSLRYAMLVTSIISLWAACHFWHVGKSVREDLSAVAGRKEQGGNVLRLEAAR
jgi:predicted MFS family arabinose efflux permease